MHLARVFTGAMAVGTAFLFAAASLPDPLPIGQFSSAEVDSNDHPAGWRPISFGDVDTRTRYRLVKQDIQGDTTHVVRAVSEAGAAGLGRSLRVDPQQRSRLTWQWKVTNVLDAGDARQEDGDDYPARLYITFDYNPSNFGLMDRVKYETLQALGYDQVPTRALNYIWANRVPKDTLLPNPYTDWVQMIAVQSGSRKVGTWTRERRNVRADYRQAFGEEPPPINGVAIMTDTDDTGESATAYYGDIIARRVPSEGDTTVVDSPN